jgi:thiol-disulfide isomerase/thioredoxin
MTIRSSLAAACLLAITTIATAAESVGTQLTIGSVAPPLVIEHWLGEGAAEKAISFEPGQVYVIEFWATWCGSCIRRMPRIAELQAEYADQRVTVVSVTDEDLATASAFLKRPVAAVEGEKPWTYADLTKNYRLAADPDRSTHTAYLEASALGSLATTFVVGKTGLIEWVGDFNSLEEPLAHVVADSWDREAFVAEFVRAQKCATTHANLYAMMRSGDLDAIESRLGELTSSEDAELRQFAMSVKPNIREQWFFMAATNDRQSTIDGLPNALQELAGDGVARHNLNKQIRTAIELEVFDDPDEFKGIAAALEAAAERHEIDDDTRLTVEALHAAAKKSAKR